MIEVKYSLTKFVQEYFVKPSSGLVIPKNRMCGCDVGHRHVKFFIIDKSFTYIGLTFNTRYCALPKVLFRTWRKTLYLILHLGEALFNCSEIVTSQPQRLSPIQVVYKFRAVNISIFLCGLNGNPGLDSCSYRDYPMKWLHVAEMGARKEIWIINWYPCFRWLQFTLYNTPFLYMGNW